MDGEELFPRGGQSALSQLERREIAQQAKRDVLFGDASQAEDVSDTRRGGDEVEGPAKKAKGRKRKAVEEEEDQPAKQKFSVDVLSFKKLSVGMLIYGAVNQVNEYEVVVSLPHGLVGYVRPTDVSPPYTDSLVAAAVAAEAEAAKGDASDSEDEETSDSSETVPLSSMFYVGQLISCIVKETQSKKDSKRRRIRLSVDATEVNQALNAEALRLGVAIQGYVSSVEEHGYIVSFGFKKRTGFLHARRTKTYIKQFNRGQALVIGQPIRCLVLEHEAGARVVPVTINPTEVAEMAATSDSMVRFSELTPGLLISGKVVQRAANGVAFSFLTGIAGMISNLHLPEQEFTANHLPPSKKIKARVIHVNLQSKVIGFSAQRHIVENTALSFPDVRIGDIVEPATVKHMDSQLGLVLQLNESNLFGFAHISHISDERVEKIGKKHRVGTQHRCRILGFNTFDGLASLSMQESILERPFLGFNDVALGALVKVVVLSVQTAGVVVEVSDHIHGFIPLMHVADIPLKKPGKKYKEGGKILCRVLEVTPSRRRMLLTAKKSLVRSELPILSKVDQAVIGGAHCGFVAAVRHYGLIVAFYGGFTGLLHRSELSAVSFDDDLSKLYYVGQVIQCQVVSTSHGKLRLTLKGTDSAYNPVTGISAGQVVSALYRSSTKNGIEVILQPSNRVVNISAVHLSDYPQHCDMLAQCLASQNQEGLKKHIDWILSRVVILSCRPLLASCKPSLMPVDEDSLDVLNFDELQIGQLLVGFVRQLVPFGVFVELPNQLVGLVPVKNVADEFLHHPADYLKIGQSVVVQIAEIDSAKQRFILSMKLSDVGLHSGPQLSECLKSFWREKTAIESYLARSSGKQKSAMECEAAARVACPDAKIGDVQDGIVQQIKSDCLVLTLPTFDSASAIALAHQHLNDFKDSSKRYKPGQTLKTEIVQLPSDTQPYILVSLGRVHKAENKSGQSQSDSSEPVKASIGDLLTVRVKSVQQLQLNVHLGHSVNGRIHVSNFTDTPKQGVWPFADVTNGDEIRCRVIGFRQVKTSRHLEISHHDFYDVAELSAKPSVVDDASLDEAALTLMTSVEEHTKRLKPRSSVVAFVKEVYKDHVNLFITSRIRARMPLLFAATSDEAVANPEMFFQPGLAVHALVSSFNKQDHSCRLTANLDIRIGQVCSCRVAKVLPDEALLVELPGVKSYARCCITDVSDRFEEDLLSNYSTNLLARCLILSKHSSGHFDVSLRPSRTTAASSRADKITSSMSDVSRHDFHDDTPDVHDPELVSVSDIKSGQVLRGYVKSAADNAGLFIRLSRTVVGRAKITNLSENFVKNWKKAYPVGKLVTVKVMAVDYDQGRVELSLRESHIFPEKRKHKSAAAAKESGEKAEKRVKLTGGRVLEVSRQGSDDDDADQDSDAELRQMMEEEGGEMLSTDSEESDAEEVGSDDDGDDMARSGRHLNAEDASDSDTDSEDAGSHVNGRAPSGCLQLAGKFDWSAASQSGAVQASQQGATSSEDEDEDAGNMSQSQLKKSKRQKRAEKKEEEAKLRSMEQALRNPDRPVETVEDLQTRIEHDQNNSGLWVQLMTCHLRSVEVEKARSVAKEALEKIDFRLEKERLSVWAAWLNVENVFGTQETLLKVFEQALQVNDPEKIFFRLVFIYLQSEKFELADELYTTMVKRFSQSRAVWEQYGLFKFRQDKPEAARRVLDRSLKSLPKFEHVSLISKFAQMEFKHGEAERGRTVFESLISNYPKRVDLWFIYIDLLQKEQNFDAVRSVFDRLASMKLSSKNMKSVLDRKTKFEDSQAVASAV